MTTKRLLAHAALASVLYLPLSANVQAQSTGCDTCTQLTTLNANAGQIVTNTTKTNIELFSLIELLTRALFSTLPSLGDTQVALTNIPNVQNGSFLAQQALLSDVEKAYKGSSSNDATLTDNYHSIFGDYLIDKDVLPFDPNKATSIASLYVNPSAAGYYSDEQQTAAKQYIMLVSGAAVSTAKAPSSTWLKVNSGDTADNDKKKIRTAVSSYYTFNAIQSAIADNFAYIYALNTPQPLIDGPLKDYSSESTISESGLFTYIQTQKIENPKWYEDIATMGVVGSLREQTVLLGSCFLMLSRIEEDLRRLLITNSVQATMTLIPAQSAAQAIAQMPDVKSLMSPS